MSLTNTAEEVPYRSRAEYARKRKAGSILFKYFNMPEAEADRYISLAAKREGTKASEIEKEVIKLGRGLV